MAVADANLDFRLGRQYARPVANAASVPTISW
jgi:hypothetical protein